MTYKQVGRPSLRGVSSPEAAHKNTQQQQYSTKSEDTYNNTYDTVDQRGVTGDDTYNVRIQSKKIVSDKKGIDQRLQNTPQTRQNAPESILPPQNDRSWPVCQNCGKPIEQRSDKPRKFCDDRCRKQKSREKEYPDTFEHMTPNTNKGGHIRKSVRLLPPIGSIVVHLDWLTWTVDWPLQRGSTGTSTELDRVLAAAFNSSDAWHIEPGKEQKPYPGYKSAIKLNYGSVHFNPARPEQRVMLTMTGGDLEGLRSAGLTDIGLLQMAYELNASITRLDVAIDYFAFADPLDLYNAFLAEQVKTTADKVTKVEDRSRSADFVGQTIYFGSASSEKRLRVYDKGAQLEVDGKWYRIELVHRREFADSLAAAMRDVGVVDAGRAAIRAFLDAPSVDWYNRAVSGPVIDFAVTARKDNKTEQWLIGMVAPVLDRVLLEQMSVGDFKIYDIFQALLDNNLRRLGNQPDNWKPEEQ